MPPKQSTRTWIKNHQLEGDGLVTGFYNFLYKKNAKMKPCEGVLIPDTIVYDHNFPRGWYTSDLKNREITKRQGKELDADSITKAFSKPPNPSVNVVASYMCSYEQDDPVTGESQTVTSVEFFNEQTVKEFVGRKTKREGILQKFMAPKGLRNSVIQAVWSPRICIVQRRTNCGSIKDKLQCERDPYPVAVTYEGPTHFSEQGECAPHTSEKVEKICNNILHHFHAIEHKFITRIVLYFKVDEKDQLWLLFCGSLRVSDKEAPSMMPLNLAPKFSSPSVDTGGSGTSAAEEELLLEADTQHYHMTNDKLFHATYVKQNSPRSKHADGEDGEAATSTTAASAAAKKQKQKDDAAAAKRRQEEEDEQWHKHPGIQDQYGELLIDRETVLSHFDDIFYEAYGHFLRHEPGNFDFEVDRKVATTLGVDVLQEMMQACRIDHALPSEDTTTVDDEELCFTIPHTGTRNPTKQIGDTVSAWVRAHYDKRLQELKEEAASMPPPDPDAAPAEKPKKEEPAAATEEPEAKPAAKPAPEEKPKKASPPPEEPRKEEPKADEPKKEEPAPAADKKKKGDVWTTLKEKLPTERTEAAKARRAELFTAFDPNGNGHVSLAEVDKGVREQFQLQDLTDDLAPILQRAHTAAKGVATRKEKRKHDDDYVQRSEFRMLLVYIKQYFELWVMFDEVDASDDRRVSLEEFRAALPQLASFGVTVDDADATFAEIDTNGGGMILFNEFAAWACAKGLDADGEGEDSDLETATAAAAAAATSDAPAEAAADEAPAAAEAAPEAADDAEVAAAAASPAEEEAPAADAAETLEAAPEAADADAAAADDAAPAADASAEEAAEAAPAADGDA